jgi:hypothetical protein
MREKGQSLKSFIVQHIRTHFFGAKASKRFFNNFMTLSSTELAEIISKRFDIVEEIVSLFYTRSTQVFRYLKRKNGICQCFAKI